MKKCTSFEEQRGVRYILGNAYHDIIVFSCLSSTKLCLRFVLICFTPQIKSFYQISLGNEADFRDIMKLFPNILAKKQDFKKMKHKLKSFIYERALITTTLTSFCHWKTLAPFCLRKKIKTYF